nr:heme attachment to plastid cytochrome c [Chloroidium sp. KL-2023a]
MISSILQEVLMPVSFGSLLCLMLLYWGQAALFSYTKYSKLTTVLFYFSFLSLTTLLIFRWVDSGHFPLSNLYESLLFLSWSFLGIQLVGQLTVMMSKQYANSSSGNFRLLTKAEQAKERVTVQPIHSFGKKELRALSLGSTSRREVAAPKLWLEPPSEETYPSDRQTKGVKTKLDFALRELSHRQLLNLLGVITSPMALLTYGFAFLNLPREMQKATALVPALQSNWLMMHVTIMILSYAALLCGSIFSMVFLLLINLNTFSPLLQIGSKPATRARFEFADAANRQTITTDRVFWANQSTLGQKVELQLSALPHKELPKLCFSDSLELRDWAHKAHTRVERTDGRLLGKATARRFDLKGLETPYLSLAERLDNYSYRVLALGFPLLTVGILSGAVWANEAWGSYWSWDPKETWALITWLVFAIYLHARILKGWTGQKPAIIATFGFFVVWFCYLGVNLLGTGLHSYGWFST